MLAFSTIEVNAYKLLGRYGEIRLHMPNPTTLDAQYRTRRGRGYPVQLDLASGKLGGTSTNYFGEDVHMSDDDIEDFVELVVHAITSLRATVGAIQPESIS